MNRYGYKVTLSLSLLTLRLIFVKKGIHVGLALYSLGAIFFWPSAKFKKYGGFVGCTFVIGGSPFHVSSISGSFQSHCFAITRLRTLYARSCGQFLHCSARDTQVCCRQAEFQPSVSRSCFVCWPYDCVKVVLPRKECYVFRYSTMVSSSWFEVYLDDYLTLFLGYI